MALVLDPLLVIATALNAISAELVAQVAALAFALFPPPLLDNAEHELSALVGSVVAVLAHCGVVENAVYDALERALHINAVIIPALDDLGDYPFDGLRGNFAGRLIQDVAEVVLREHRVSWVGTVVVVENDVLLITGALDDLRRTSRKLVLDLFDNGKYVWSEEREDEDVDLLLDLLDEFWEHRDLLDRLRDALHDLIVVLENGADLPRNVV